MREAAIMSAADIRRAVTRIAHEVIENNRGTQGAVAAHRLISLVVVLGLGGLLLQRRVRA